jgi:predicted CopG family antitoxin
MPVTKRIPVSEDRWKELGRMKEAGQTYDELLKELIQAHNRALLAEKIRASREMDDSELIPLE